MCFKCNMGNASESMICPNYSFSFNHDGWKEEQKTRQTMKAKETLLAIEFILLEMKGTLRYLLDFQQRFCV